MTTKDKMGDEFTDWLLTQQGENGTYPTIAEIRTYWLSKNEAITKQNIEKVDELNTYLYNNVPMLLKSDVLNLFKQDEN